jgi:hypothetical protein
MAFSERIYSDPERAACIATFGMPGITAERVSELASAGELTDHNGDTLPAFQVPPSTVRDFKRKARRRTDRPSPLVALPARDAVEALRQRLVALADAEIGCLERQVEGKRDLNRMFEASRCVREAARIPGPADPRPAKPGAKANGRGLPGDSETRGGPAGPLLREHRASGTVSAMAPTPKPEPVPEPAPEDPREQLERELRASIARAQAREREAVAPAGPGPAAEPAAEQREPRRRRERPAEDTSSISAEHGGKRREESRAKRLAKLAVVPNYACRRCKPSIPI